MPNWAKCDMPQLLRPFLTDIDPRAAIKGSRDPLGTQAIWTRFGRQVVGNLTTVSTSVLDFATLLLGHYFIESVRAISDDEDDLGVFLRWEQLAAYARAHVNHDFSFRGTARARANLQGRTVRLSAERVHQILSNQKTYGLWGLYTVPARASGLLEGEPLRLSRSAREFVEREYLPRLAKHRLGDGRALIDKVRRDTRLDHNGGDAQLLAAVASLLHRDLSAAERVFYHEHLVLGGVAERTDGVQPHLAAVLVSTLGDGEFRFSLDTLEQLALQAGAQSVLSDCLTRIRHCESVLAPSSWLFDYLLSWHNEPLEALARTIREQWGERLLTIDPKAFRGLRGELQAATGSADASAGWIRIGESLAAGAYEDTLGLLVARNRQVMFSRGASAPWAEVREGRLHVQVRNQSGDLPGEDELADLWRHPYFIYSLREVARALQVA